MQNEFSLLYRTEAEETLHTTRALNITFVAYSPLGRGLLTGAVAGQSDLAEADARRRHPRFAPENLGRNVALVQRIEEIAQAKKCTPGQLALAWLLARGEDIVPIPGTKRPRAPERECRRARSDARARPSLRKSPMLSRSAPPRAYVILKRR